MYEFIIYFSFHDNCFALITELHGLLRVKYNNKLINQSSTIKSLLCSLEKKKRRNGHFRSISRCLHGTVVLFRKRYGVSNFRGSQTEDIRHTELILRYQVHRTYMRRHSTPQQMYCLKKKINFFYLHDSWSPSRFC